MHSRALRIMAGSCLILSAGVFINVLFLQEQEVNRQSVHADWQEYPAREHSSYGSFVAGGVGDANRYAAKPQPSQSLIRAVQRELAERKYYRGQLDGSLTIYTRAAVMDYQTEHRQPLTGEVSETLLHMILLGTSLETTPSDTDITPQARYVVRHIQSLLKQVGLDEVQVTGRLDAATLSAIREFELYQRLPPKGRISQGLLVQLEHVSRERKARRDIAAR